MATTHAGRRRVHRIAVVACVLALFACGDGDDVPVTLRPFEAVTVGEQHSCGLAESGEAYCWGDGESGALGTGTRDTERFAVPVAGELLFTALTAGGAHTCGLTADGTAYCWGANSDGQLGIVRAGDVLAPEPVETDVRFASISAGWSHTCAIDLAGTAYCWGRGTSGELGTGAFPATIPNPTAVATSSAPAAGTAAA
jgi:hypothetical protein